MKIYKSKNFKWYGAIKYSVYLNSCDIGICEIEGKERFCTYGRNLLEKEAMQYDSVIRNIEFIKTDFGFYEILFPENEKETIIKLTNK